MDADKTERIATLVRLPRDVRDFLVNEAAHNCATQNSEIVRSVRQRMEREREALAAKERALASAGAGAP